MGMWYGRGSGASPVHLIRFQLTLMRSYKLEGYSTARVWTKECPVRGESSDGRITIEISIPRGGMCEYGLLGGSLQNRHARAFEIAMPPVGDVWHSSLVSQIDKVRAGLPEEYSAAVILAAEQRASESKLTQYIQFDCACHAEVGSNPNLFGRLAGAVVSCLVDTSIAEDDGRMKDLLEGLRIS